MTGARLAPHALLLGLVTLLGQTLLARELLVLVHGSELALGATLAAWLLLAGLGSALAGRALAARTGASAAALTVLGAACALGVPAAVLVARSATLWLPGSGAAVPDPGAALPAVIAATALVALPAGAWFAAAAAHAGGAAGPGRAYAWEAGGALAGGLAFTFALAGRADAFVIAAGLAAAALGALGALLAADASLPRRRRLALAGLLGAAAAAALLADPALDLADRSRRARWPGLRLAAWHESRRGSLALLEHGGQHTLAVSGAAAFTFPDAESAEAAAHLPLLAAPSVGRVLLAGGALGGALGEALRHPVREADCLEPDPEVVGFVRPFLGPAERAALADPRVRVRNEDLRSWLAANPGRYDAILLGVPEPATALANRLATREFFALVRAALREGGVAALALPTPPNYLGPELRQRNGSVHRALAEAFPRVELLAAEPLLLVASAAPAPLLDPRRMAERLAERGLRLRTLSGEALASLADRGRAAFHARELETSGAPANRDLAPAAYFHHARHREALASPGRARWLARLAGPARWGVLALPALLLAAGLAAPGGPARPGLALGLAAASTGLAAMALQYLVLFAYQTGRGLLYAGIGLLAGTFMGGLALGGAAALRRTRGRSVARDLRRSDLALALLPLAAAPALAALVGAGARGAGLPADLLALMLAGVVGAAAGFEFPLLALAHPAAAADAGLGGRLYGSELLGSAAGALLVSLWLLPLLGLAWSLAFLSLLKLASLATLARALPR